MIEILLIEDDPVLGRGITVTLELEGYRVHRATDLKSASRVNGQIKVDLYLLDLGLPDGSGIRFLNEIRKSGSRTPVVILTARSDEDSVVEGLESGANDYVRKPFGNRELLARIKIALKEVQNREHQIRYGDLHVLVDQRRILYGEKPIEFNRREFDIIKYLVEHAEAVVTRKVLLDALDPSEELLDRTVDSHVCHVRSKLRRAEAFSIQISSVYGVGYRLEKR